MKVIVHVDGGARGNPGPAAAACVISSPEGEVLGGAEGQASDVEIRVKYMLKLKQRLNSILAKHTGRTVEQVEKDCDRDNFMSAEEAKNYGLVDQVVQSRKEIPGAMEKSSVVV